MKKVGCARTSNARKEVNTDESERLSGAYEEEGWLAELVTES